MEDSQTCASMVLKSCFSCSSFSSVDPVPYYVAGFSAPSSPVFHPNVMLQSISSVYSPNLVLFCTGEDAYHLRRFYMFALNSAPHRPELISPLLLWPADVRQPYLEQRLAGAPSVLKRPVPFENDQCSRLPRAAADAISYVLTAVDRCATVDSSVPYFPVGIAAQPIQCQPYQAPPLILRQALQRSTPAASTPSVHQGIKAEAADDVRGGNYEQSTGSVHLPFTVSVAVQASTPRVTVNKVCGVCYCPSDGTWTCQVTDEQGKRRKNVFQPENTDRSAHTKWQWLIDSPTSNNAENNL
eukprot:GHVT01019082.1.p1 GENE.GHVT01019082.1~~GHVT01019082.1.p1  ORF type:complete len:298 (+),score=32.39 GHVT01019082.1:863-1756(+)